MLPHTHTPLTAPCAAPRYKDEKTCGIIAHDEAGGMTKIAEPVGVVAGVPHNLRSARAISTACMHE